MKTLFLVLTCFMLCTSTGCSFAGSSSNPYNPYVQSRLPAATPTAETAQAMEKLGGKSTTIQDEASHRKYWKEELYPIAFGEKKATHTIMVLLDYADQKSQQIWDIIDKTTRKLDPNKVQVVVFGNSKEQYGTELMGYGIWISILRPKQTMAYYSYSLSQWNDVKRRQKASRGKAIPFQYEFDSTAGQTERPFVYSFIDRLSPPLPEKQQSEALKYVYDAGNINMFQAVEIAKNYGVKSLPAVIIDGTVLKQVTEANILAAVRGK